MAARKRKDNEKFEAYRQSLKDEEALTTKRIKLGPTRYRAWLEIFTKKWMK